jgi:uncharacterized protein (DUF1330 family)
VERWSGGAVARWSGGAVARWSGERGGTLVAAYVIAIVDVKDPVRYEDYRKTVLPTITAFGGKFIARGGHTEVLEGTWAPRRMVILEFPSVERAKVWWSSPEYAGPKALRQATSEGTLILIEGV